MSIIQLFGMLAAATFFGFVGGALTVGFGIWSLWATAVRGETGAES